MPKSLACPLPLCAGHACLRLPDTACVVHIASAVGRVLHYGNVPAVPLSVLCVWPRAVEGADGSRPCVRVGGQGPHRVLPGWGGCGRTAAVLPQGSGVGGPGLEVDVRVHAGGPAVHLGVCRCSRNSVCVPVAVQARLLAAPSGCGFGHRVCPC